MLIYNIMPLHQKQSNRTTANLQSLGGLSKDHLRIYVYVKN